MNKWDTNQRPGMGQGPEACLCTVLLYNA
jgi:hypothetical protein